MEQHEWLAQDHRLLREQQGAVWMTTGMSPPMWAQGPGLVGEHETTKGAKTQATAKVCEAL